MSDNDLKLLCQKILGQAMNDYVGLQSFSHRTESFLQEAWYASIDLFFDPNYLLDISSVLDKKMGLQELIEEASDIEEPDIPKLQAFVAKDAKNHWDKQFKYIPPDNLIFEGYVYMVTPKPLKRVGWNVCHQTYDIFINNKLTPVAMHKAITAASVRVINYYVETTGVTFNDALSRFIRMNKEVL